jgi:GTPase SAR1 family protein/FtsZ-binding cell division protein ZapB
METHNLLNDLEKVARARAEIANSLAIIAHNLEKAESESQEKSGKLELDRDIKDLKKNSINLREGLFRLLVLGDMKRGKSTFLNALLGENLLPSDVNPCTALLTVLRYGAEKKVTVHFNNGTKPEQIDFQEFKHRYTIDPAEAKRLEQNQQLAFPNVEYALVEYPLPLLEKGIEIIDSPGLNDTEARNNLSLGYINNCHAILFVLRATQPCTLAERRYLENYIKDRGLTVFFLINAWDQIKESLIDPDDSEELAEATTKLNRVFKANLSEYCQVEGDDLYAERVFPISSLNALRKRIKNSNTSLEDTGFPQFIQALNLFLTQEKAIAEFRQSRIIAQQTANRVKEAVERRIPLLEQDVAELKVKINSVEPEFKLLNKIRDDFQQEIREIRDTKATSISESFRDFILRLGDTFETDFIRYQPDLSFLDFLSSQKRERFEKELSSAFEQYINDKLTEWSRSAESEMETAFARLSDIALSYGKSYNKITDTITEKLTGNKIPPVIGINPEDNAPGWAKWAAGIFSLARGNLAGVALAGAGFDWKNIMLNFITVLGVGSIITGITGLALGPIGFALLGLGIGVLQADRARQELVKVAKKELVKYLPQVAREQAPKVQEAIQECFVIYEREITERMNDDINSRKAELDNLIERKESIEIDRVTEISRLQELEKTVSSEADKIEFIYHNLLASYS